jgi:hypothetical protein
VSGRLWSTILKSIDVLAGPSEDRVLLTMAQAAIIEFFLQALALYLKRIDVPNLDTNTQTEDLMKLILKGLDVAEYNRFRDNDFKEAQDTFADDISSAQARFFFFALSGFELRVWGSSPR